MGKGVEGGPVLVVEVLVGGTGNAEAGGENTLDELEVFPGEILRDSNSFWERGGGIGRAAFGGGDKRASEGGMGSGDFGGASGNFDEGGFNCVL